MSIKFSFKDAVVKADHVLVKAVGESGVLLNLKTESYYGLDAIGYDFFLKLTSANNIQAAFEALIEEYEADPIILKADLEELIGNLLVAEIITINEL